MSIAIPTTTQLRNYDAEARERKERRKAARLKAVETIRRRYFNGAENKMHLTQIHMIVGDWFTDEHGVKTRFVRAAE